MPLPNEHERPPTPPQMFRLSIGEVAATASGKTAPRKMDYFTIRSLVRQNNVPVYVVDAPLQKRMCEAAKVTEKPSAIPVTLLGNVGFDEDNRPVIPDSILFAEMARYWGGRRECCCKAWGEDGRGEATLRRYAKKTSGNRTYTVKTGDEQIVCDPETCPYATGKHSVQKYEGIALCKPHVIASVCLPFAPAVGGAAKFKTTGWACYYSMRDSLLTIANETQGWLHGLPLTMVLAWARSADGHSVPAVRFEYQGTALQLRGATLPLLKQWTGQEESIKLLQAGSSDATVRLLDNPDDAAATAVEFYGADPVAVVEPEAVADAEEVPTDTIEGECEDLSDQSAGTNEEITPEPEAQPEPETPTLTPVGLVVAKQKELANAGYPIKEIIATTKEFRADIAPEASGLPDLNEEEATFMVACLQEWADDNVALIGSAKEDTPAPLPLDDETDPL